MKLRKTIIPVMASLVMTVSSYAEKDVTVLSFEDNSVMSSNTEGLKREIPKMLETRLSPDFDVIINPDSTVTSEGYNKESTAILKERLQGLDYRLDESGKINKENCFWKLSFIWLLFV